MSVHTFAWGITLVTMSISPAFAEHLRIANFDSSTTEADWEIVNDTVMGGRSESGFAIENGQLRFSGTLNTNGGGFASIRSGPLQRNLSAYSIVRLRVLGDGRPYRLRLFVAGDRATYQHEFSTVAREWRVVELSINQFYASRRGRPLERPPLVGAKVDALGLMLADVVDGPFSLAVDWIEFDR